jgi:hypothetical protein
MRKIFVLSIISSWIFLSAGFVQSQQSKAPEAPGADEAEVQWLWGEVASLDAPNKVLVVKYLDYDTDIEKQMTITADEKTEFENVKSIDEIKSQDTISIDYIVGPDNRNIAKVISVERMEEIAVSEEDMPEDMEKVGSGPLSSESGLIPPDEETTTTTSDSKANQ